MVFDIIVSCIGIVACICIAIPKVDSKIADWESKLWGYIKK